MKLFKYILFASVCLQVHGQAPGVSKDILIPQRKTVAPYDFAPIVINGAANPNKALGFATDGTLTTISTISGGITSPISFTELVSSPGSSPGGTVYLYAKTDKLMYQKDSNGVEQVLPGGGPSGITLAINQFAARTAAGTGGADTAITIGGDFSLGGNTLALVGEFVTAVGIETLTNKRIVPRIQSIGNSTTPLVADGNLFDKVEVLNMQQASHFDPPSGTPTNGQELTFIIGASVARNVTWATIYMGSDDLPLPTNVGSSIISGGPIVDMFKFMYSTAKAKWLFVGELRGFR